jgi:diamine N-acetyltransferase
MIKYFKTDEKELDRIKDLWNKLRLQHQLKSSYFSKDYETIVFEDRKEQLLKKSEKWVLKVDLAFDNDNLVGYCVSSVSNDKGEIDSIFIEKKYRSVGIGDKLMKRALTWMDNMGVKNKKILISFGNEEAIEFYSRYGFYPKHILLKQPEND